MKKFKTIVIIILSVLLFIVIGINTIQYIFSLKKDKEIAGLKLENETIIDNFDKKENVYVNLIADRDKTISDYKLNKPKTEKEIIYYETIKKDTKLIEELREDNKQLKTQLEKTNKALKSIYYIKHGLSLFALAGIDRELEIDVYTGIIYRRYLFKGRFFIGGGAAIKLYDEIGVSGLFELGFTF